jgi:hypothetical protein
VVYGDVSTGAENDLQQATRPAHGMMARWGMSPRLGAVYYADHVEGAAYYQHLYSEATAQLIDAEVTRTIEECLDQARYALQAERGRLDALARALLSEEHLEEDEILTVVGLEHPDLNVVQLAPPHQSRWMTSSSARDLTHHGALTTVMIVSTAPCASASSAASRTPRSACSEPSVAARILWNTFTLLSPTPRTPPKVASGLIGALVRSWCSPVDSGRTSVGILNGPALCSRLPGAIVIDA